MKDRVIEVANEKAKSMIYTDEGVRMINKKVSSVEEFNEVYDKKISLVDKSELLFADMKKLSLDGLKVDPNVGFKFGNSVSDIVFNNQSDMDEFIKHISSVKGWSRVEKQSSVFNAIKWDITGLVVAPIIGFVLRGMALDIESGNFVSDNVGNSRSDRKGRMLESIVEMVGSTGILIIAILATAYFAYSAYKKYQNPPTLVSYE